MSTTMLKYTLDDFDRIMFDGFDYTVPDATLAIIADLSSKVGSPGFAKLPSSSSSSFAKRDGLGSDDLPSRNAVASVNPYSNLMVRSSTSTADKKRPKKPRSGDGMSLEKGNGSAGGTVQESDWENLRAFQSTQLEEKTGVAAKINEIRGFINKLTETNYADICAKTTVLLRGLSDSPEELRKAVRHLFDIASGNRFFSKLYATLYSEWMEEFQVCHDVLKESFHGFMELCRTVECPPDPTENYDDFCRVNRCNEERKALALFYVNLTRRGMQDEASMVRLTRDLLQLFFTSMVQENQKPVIDELAETIALLYQKDWVEQCDTTVCAPIVKDDDAEGARSFTIHQAIEHLTNCRVQSFPSFTNKARFKFMDLIDV